MHKISKKKKKLGKWLIMDMKTNNVFIIYQANTILITRQLETHH